MPTPGQHLIVALTIAALSPQTTHAQDALRLLQECESSCSPLCAQYAERLSARLERYRAQCGDTTPTPPDPLTTRTQCIEAARAAGFGLDRSERFCLTPPTHALRCLPAAKAAGFGLDRSERFCERPDAQPHDDACLAATKIAGYGLDRSERFCERAPNTAPGCLAAAKAVGFGLDRSERTCERAPANVAACLRSAHAQNYGLDRIERTCQP